MRQRLGVAQAILHRPKLLILDEPTNGLDPAGIKELRDILKNLAHKENICVIVSSHLMSEMELMCDRVGIIVNGKLTGVHTVEEMISAASGDKEQFILRVIVSGQLKCLTLLVTNQCLTMSILQYLLKRKMLKKNCLRSLQELFQEELS